MRRAAWIAIAAAALSLAVASVSSASQGPSSGGTRVINLISRATDINDFVDFGPPGPSPGDLYVFSDRLFLPSSPNDPVGTSDGRCVLIDPTAFRFDCSITAKLSDGEIMFAGTLTLVEDATSVGAIVGGTGAYQRVRGEGSTTLGPLEGPHEVTIKLILNP